MSLDTSTWSKEMRRLNAKMEGLAPNSPDIGKPITAPKPRKINKTESEYGRMLAAQYPQANIRYEGYTLKLADRCRYSPDFAVEFPSGKIEFHEVKGAFIFSKALTKPKAAAEIFPQRFVLAQKLKGGEWRITALRGKADKIL